MNLLARAREELANRGFGQASVWVGFDAAEMVRLTTQTTAEGATHWSTRKLAAKLGISYITVL